MYFKPYRGGTTLLTLGKRVFAIGGNWAPANLTLSATVEEYNIAAGTWSVVPRTLLGGRKNFAALSVPSSAFSHLPQGCTGVK